MNQQFCVKNYLEEQCKEQNIEIPATLGTSKKDKLGNIISSEVQLTEKNDLHTNQLLDYIIELIPVSNYEYKSTEIQKLNLKNITVQKFEVTDKNSKVAQLSDHYGLSAEFSYCSNENKLINQ
eukprot:TRINITY_DN8156_c0_g2_i1.p3 TRINITY_DN8156_c0_g2~~TRINITY_DN8156_c0_g2_i1.p3  ORF type:complete len:123 (-),score=26.56 TRINITY_DN8156_c0_g2_i1:20-388(-)